MKIVYDYSDVPTIRDFAKSDKFIRGLMGPFGSGKSTGCLMEIIRRAHEQKPGKDGIRRTRWAIVRNCFDDKTEILTDNGWRLFRDLAETDKVAQLSDSDELEFVQPSYYYQADYIGEMIGFEGEGVDFLVTPDHKLNVSLRNARRKSWSPYRFRTAKECFGKQNMRVKRDAAWKGETPHSVDFFEWLGFWFAEGVSGEYGGRRQCVITQVNDLQYVRDLFGRAGLPFTESGGYKKSFRLSVTPKTVGLITELSKVGKSTTKSVPGWIKNATQAHLRAFIEGYDKGDGDHSTVRRLNTSSKRLADDLQDIALRAGLVANVRSRNRALTYYINGASGVCAPQYTVTITGKSQPKLTATGYRGWYKTNYAGKVYCVEVPTHRVYVRRNGVAHWSSQTYPQLRDTTIKTVHDWLPPNRFGQWKQQDHDYLVTAFKGCHIEMMFRALDRPDQVSNLLSLELTGAWLNEAREVPKPIFEAIQGRVGRFPAVKDGGCTWDGIIMDTNPPDLDSWWYKLFEERIPPNAAVFKQPSGLSPNAENRSHLKKNYYENLSLGKDPEWVKVYVQGEYGFVIDGKPIYSGYSDQVHCQKVTPIKGVTVYRGWDFGLTPACVFTQLTPTGQWIVFDELVAEDMGIDRFSDRVIQHCNQFYRDFVFEDIGDPAGQKRSETDEKSCFQILWAKGIQISGGEQDPTIRIESVRKPLNTLINGKPGFVLSPSCKTLRKGFQGGYQYRRLQTSGERFTEKPDKNQYSHPHDALQYVATRLFSQALRTPKTDEPKYTKKRWLSWKTA